ncbi:MAG: hypothetical protein RBR71_08225 [Gudongella sp.]|nr:hypothetical protein [Gudongella sp.]
MIKKMIFSLVFFIAFLSVGQTSYATSTINQVTTTTAIEYEIIKPERKSYSSSEKVVLINGKAPSGTEVTIEMYGTTDLTRRNFNLDNLPLKDDYIMISTESVISGNMGFFQKQLNLVSGINRIIINFGVEGVEDEEIIVYKYDVVRSSVSLKYIRTNTSRTLIPLIR